MIRVSCNLVVSLVAGLLLLLTPSTPTEPTSGRSLLFATAQGPSKNLTRNTCWGCWRRGELVSSYPDCICSCNAPGDPINDNPTEFVRRDLASHINTEDEGSNLLTLLYPTCRYLSSERRIFDATFNVPTYSVTTALFQRRIEIYLGLMFEDQYAFRSLVNSTETPGYSVLQFDIRDDDTGNNYSAALLSARTALQIHETRLTAVSVVAIGYDEPGLIAIAASDIQVAPVHREVVIGNIEGYPVYVETGYFFFGGILLTCLMVLLEAAMTDNVAGDGMTMKEWMAPRGDGMPNGDGVVPGALVIASDDILPSVASPNRRRSSVKSVGFGEVGNNQSPLGERRKSKSAWMENNNNEGEAYCANQGGEYSGQYVESEGEDDEEEEEESPKQAAGFSRFSSAREDPQASALDKKKSRVGSKYFI